MGGIQVACDRCGYEGPHTLVVEGERTTWRCAECDRVIRPENGDISGLRLTLARIFRELTSFVSNRTQ